MTFSSANAITGWGDAGGGTASVTGNGTYTPNAINGQSVVHFSTSQYMKNTINYASPCTIFAIEQETGAGSRRESSAG